MDYLNKFFETVFQPATPTPENRALSDLSKHLEQRFYDDFELTDAVRPGLDLSIKPTQGYRHDVYIDPDSKCRVPVIMASASKEILFSVFMQLIQRLGQTVDIVLETSHQHQTNGHIDLYREQMDMPVLSSVLWEYEDLLLNDGCTGIAVLNPRTPQEVQFDEHKLLIIYGSPLEPFEHVLEKNGIYCNEDIRFITEAEHVHSSSDQLYRHFQNLQTELGLDRPEKDRAAY
jgi:hypothetical protein